MAPLFPPQFNYVTRTGWLLALDCLSMCVCVCGSLLGVCWLSDAGIRNKRWLTQNEWMDCEPSECFHCYGVLAHLRKR